MFCLYSSCIDSSRFVCTARASTTSLAAAGTETCSSLAGDAVRLGLELAQSAADLDAHKAAGALRLLYTVANSNETRFKALQAALVIAQLPHMAGKYPQMEAHWLVATAHNAACDAKGLRDSQQAEAYMQAAMQLASATACKAIAAVDCKETLQKWGALEAESAEA